ncbi:hypothetical protein GGH92_000256 [Coemansia sp. RSA 2673]|nr:hypothetical protein GGH92_000256 [Coemansia sp. RSA 2673]
MNVSILLLMLVGSANGCLFALAGTKYKFLHSVGAACIVNNMQVVMKQYDSFVGVSSMGFNENGYHMEYYFGEKRIHLTGPSLDENITFDRSCGKDDDSDADFGCYFNDTEDCYSMCDWAFSECMRFYNQDAQRMLDNIHKSNVNVTKA